MSDTSTRSGMLWEVERILSELKEKPQVLLMENVPQVHSADNVEDFNKWQLRLEELGYKNYWQDLIATDYGIPQIRNRCFMVSILGNYNYTFPKKIPLKLKLKDLLEDSVDTKYFLSEKMILGMINTKFNQYSLKSRLQDLEDSVDTLTCATGDKAPHCIAINNNNNKGYALATDGDGIDISSRMKHHRGTVQKGKAQTLTTQCDRGVVVNDNYIQWKQKGHLDIDCRAYFENTVAPTTTTTPKSKVLQSDLKIRRLTPRECFRLMGVKDDDFDKVAINQSDASLYHLAGDSIVVDVLKAIYGEMI